MGWGWPGVAWDGSGENGDPARVYTTVVGVFWIPKRRGGDGGLVWEGETRSLWCRMRLCLYEGEWLSACRDSLLVVVAERRSTAVSARRVRCRVGSAHMRRFLSYPSLPKFQILYCSGSP